MNNSMEENFFNLEDGNDVYKTKEQGTPLRCWGRVGFKMPRLSEIFIPPEYFQKTHNETPKVKNILLHKLEGNENIKEEFSNSDSSNDNLFLTSAPSSSSLSVESYLFANKTNNLSELTVQDDVNVNRCQRVSETLAKCNISDQDCANLNSNLLVPLPRDEQPQVKHVDHDSSTSRNDDLFVPLPRKSQLKPIDEGVSSKKSECRKKRKNKKSQKLLLSSVFVERESIGYIGQLRNKQYTLQLNCHAPNNESRLPSISNYLAETVSYALPDHYHQSEIYDSDLEDSAEYPDIPEAKLSESHEHIPTEKKSLTFTDIARSLLPVVDASSNPGDAKLAKSENILPNNCLIIENVPKYVDHVEIEALLQSFGPIRQLEYKDEGVHYNLTLYIDSDLEWMVECLHDTFPFGEFSEALNVYIK